MQGELRLSLHVFEPWRNGVSPSGRVLSLNTLIEEVVTFLAHELQAKAVTPELRLDDHLPLLLVDRTQMQQVVVNLAVNAMQAMGHHMRNGSWSLPLRCWLTSECRFRWKIHWPRVYLTIQASCLTVSTLPKRRAWVWVLPICRSIIEAHGGNITAQNSDGGARFTVTLPAPIIP